MLENMLRLSSLIIQLNLVVQSWLDFSNEETLFQLG